VALVIGTIQEQLKRGLTKLLGVTDKKGYEVASVDSTAITEIEYNITSSLMKVTFTSGATYIYAGVPESEYEALVESSSIGRTFVKEIRNDYVYFRIG